MSDETRLSIRCPCCDKVDLTDLEIRRIIHVGSWFGARQTKKTRALRRYEMWSFATGCKRLRNDLEILRCPGIDCDNFFLVKGRQEKLRNEPTWYWNPLSRKWLYRSPCSRDGGDARRIYCQSCRKAFCSLCRRSWQQPRKGYRVVRDDAQRAAPIESHDHKACVAFAGRSINPEDDFQAVGEAAGARACPSCSLRVERTYGCNHIECPNCSQHWCFICEVPWDSSHYACRDVDGDTFKVQHYDPNCAMM